MEFKEVFFDETGYAELKKHMRQATEFSVSMINIFQERAEIEHVYAKSIAKLKAKALKCNKDSTGSLMAAWNSFCEHLEVESENHKKSVECLQEDICKKLRASCEAHLKTRKTTEAGVDKACKAWHDGRSELIKAKKATYSKAKESESMQVVLENPSAKGKVFSEKELGKLQSKSKKADEVASKADADYLNLIKATERARHDFETVLRQAVTSLEKLEKERISQQKEGLLTYVECQANVQEPLMKNIDNLMHAVNCINPDNDILAIAQLKGRQADHVPQVLYDPYEEDLSNGMTLARRRQSLNIKLKSIDIEIQKETKAKAGVARLSGVYSENPSYGDASAQENVTQQLTHSDEMLNMFRACRFKITAALAMMDKQPVPTEEISSFIKTEKDKHQGVQFSTLKMPRNVPSSLRPVSEVDGRGMGDGAHYLPTAPMEENGKTDNDTPHRVIGQCQVKFDYEASEPEEMSLQEGQIINIIEKFEDGWWYGEVNGQKGNFPGSYVDLL